jgi:hypothetical protein
MKAKELADFLLEHPDWNVQFLLTQEPDEVNESRCSWLDIIDVADRVARKTIILFGEEHEQNN